MSNYEISADGYPMADGLEFSDETELPYSVILDFAEVLKYFEDPDHWMHSVRTAVLLPVKPGEVYVLYVLDNRRPSGEFADSAPFWRRMENVPGMGAHRLHEDDYYLAVGVIGRGGGSLAIYDNEELYRDESIFPPRK